MEQEQLRKYCKWLKWNKGIHFYQIAKKIGMEKHSFYNFLSGKKVSLGYGTEWLLKEYIKEELSNARLHEKTYL